MGPMIELVEPNLAAERVAVNSEQTCCAGLVAPRPIQDTFDEFLFEFIDGFVELYPAFHHLPDQRFQLIFHRARSPQELFAAGRTGRIDLFKFVAR